MSGRPLVEVLQEAVERAPQWGELSPRVSIYEQLVIAFERAALDISREFGGMERVDDYGQLRHEIVTRLIDSESEGARDE